MDFIQQNFQLHVIFHNFFLPPSRAALVSLLQGLTLIDDSTVLSYCSGRTWVVQVTTHAKQIPQNNKNRVGWGKAPPRYLLLQKNHTFFHAIVSSNEFQWGWTIETITNLSFFWLLTGKIV